MPGLTVVGTAVPIGSGEGEGKQVSDLSMVGDGLAGAPRDEEDAQKGTVMMADGAHDDDRDNLDELSAMEEEANALAPLLERAKAVFETLDTDGTGTLCKKELKAGLQADEAVLELLGTDGAETLAKMDLDGDEEVTWMEFEMTVTSAVQPA